MQEMLSQRLEGFSMDIHEMTLLACRAGRDENANLYRIVTSGTFRSFMQFLIGLNDLTDCLLITDTQMTKQKDNTILASFNLTL